MARVKSSAAAAGRRSDALAKGKKARAESFTRKVLSVVKRANPDEVKYVDMMNTIGTPINLSTNTFSTVLVNGVPTGTSENDRIGMHVNNKYAQITVSMYQASAATNANIRCMLVQSSVNSTTPTALDLLEQSSVYSFPSTVRKGDWKVLRDELVQVNNTSSSGVAAIIKWYVPLDKLALPSTHYNGTGSTVGSVVKGGIWLIFMSDTAVSASMSTGTARSGIDYYTRFAYTDN